MSGDATINNAGALTIAANAVEAAMVEATAAGRIWGGNAGGTGVAAVALSGDATLASTGALTISANAVETSMVASGAVTGPKLGTGFMKRYIATAGETANTFLVCSGAVAPTPNERILGIEPLKYASGFYLVDQYSLGSGAANTFGAALTAGGHLFQKNAGVSHRVVVYTIPAAA